MFCLMNLVLETVLGDLPGDTEPEAAAAVSL